MAAPSPTPAPYLKNLSALENEAANLTAVTPHSAAVAYSAFTGFTKSGVYTTATAGALPTITTPSFPATGVGVVNTNAALVNVVIAGGTVTNVTVNGTSVGTGDGTYPLPAGATIAVTYTGSPTWTWADTGGMPGPPAGYVLAVVNGNLVKFPFFNV